MPVPGQRHVGTAGWAIPAHCRDRVPGSGSQLQRYAQGLNAAEINSSFHRHHRLQTYARWAASVPAYFRFAVKMPRALSHAGELMPAARGAGVEEVLERFLSEVGGLGEKLAVLLLQLPPKLAFNESSAATFFSALRKRTDLAVACEPRHPSWGSPAAEGLLSHHAVARVAADPARWPGADEPGGAGDLAYFRWHGQPRMYYSDYDAQQLAELRQRAVRAQDRASDVWIIFDNTVLGHALRNALTLGETMQLEPQQSAQR